MALNGKIGFGVIVAFMMYVRYFTQPLSQIAQAVQSLQSAAAAGERVNRIAHEHVTERRLARPVRSHEHMHLALRHIEVDFV